MRHRGDPRLFRDGHPLECEKHPQQAALACVECCAAGLMESSDAGRASAEAATSLIGAPFRFMGRTARGVDCIGLVLFCFRAAGWTLPELKVYSMDLEDVDIERLAREMAPCDETRKAREGDALLFRIGKKPRHFGIVTARGTLVSANDVEQRVVEHGIDYQWSERYVLSADVRGAT
jgi:cell wall-associated NlpC family hydrolase